MSASELEATQLEQLEWQLAQLNEREPNTAPERQKIESDKKNLTQRVANLKSYLILAVGTLVTDGQKVGTVSTKHLTPGGMPEVWVTWAGPKGLLPEQPARLTVVTPPTWAVVPSPQLGDDAPTVASLFTGGGLFEAGAMTAGFRPLWGIEHDSERPDFSKQIADAYEQNFGGHIIRKSVQEVAQGGFKHLERPTGLHISQPCKSFSAANSQTESETDLSAARAVQQAIKELQPLIITIENVTSYRDSQSWQLIRETLTNLGYSIKEATVNAVDYGVPQKRQRFLAWAARSTALPSLGELGAKTSPCGWLEALADLIPSLPESELANWQQERLPELDRNQAYLIERTGARKERDLLVRPATEPMWTVKASIATDQKGSNRKDPVNLMLADGSVMSLNARALARLQSVPDWYELPEPIGVAVTLIGNGVPCLLAQHLMETLKPLVETSSSSELITPNSELLTPNSTVWLALDEIRRDGGTQPRVKMELAHIKRLEEQIEEGQQLEPVVVFHDGESYWMADGFHRWQAHSNQEQEALACEVALGSRRDAILYSVGANADHKPALPRSREDKRRAVLTLLQDPEWSHWTQTAIAKSCKVSRKFVNQLAQQLTPSCNRLQDTKREITRNGVTYTIDTTNIGSKKDSTPLEAEEERLEAVVESSQEKQSDFPEVSQSSPVPAQKVEVSTNDILIAFTSNLDCLSEAQVEAAVRALAVRNRKTLYQQLFDTDDQQRLDEVVTALLEYWEPDEISDQLNQHSPSG